MKLAKNQGHREAKFFWSLCLAARMSTNSSSKPPAPPTTTRPRRDDKSTIIHHHHTNCDSSTSKMRRHSTNSKFKSAPNQPALRAGCMSHRSASATDPCWFGSPTTSCHILLFVIIFYCLISLSMSNNHFSQQVSSNRRLFSPPTSHHKSPLHLISAAQQPTTTSTSRQQTTNGNHRENRLIKLRHIDDESGNSQSIGSGGGGSVDKNNQTSNQTNRLALIQNQLIDLRRQLEAELLINDQWPQSIRIGSPCIKSSDCSKRISNSHCKSESNYTCSCLHLHVEFNSTTCLAPSLLGYECQLDAQCQQKVANSRCDSGKCGCSNTFVPYRRDKCLAASQINDYCLADKQCQLNDKHSFCKWLIPHVYGQCKCPPNYKLITAVDQFVQQQPTATTTTGNATNKMTTKCAPRLGDTCLDDTECLLATKNSHCGHQERQSSSPSGTDLLAAAVARHYGAGWPTSGAGPNKCQCARGFQAAPNQLDCWPARQLLANTTTATTMTATTPTTTMPTIAAAAAAVDQNDFARQHHYDMIASGASGGAGSNQVSSNSAGNALPPSKRKPEFGGPLAAAADEQLDIKLLPGSKPKPKPGPTRPVATAAAASGPQVIAQQNNNQTTPTRPKPGSASDISRPKFRMSSLGKSCSSSRECQARDPYSDCIGGVCECLRPTAKCRASLTGCHKDTFQCRNGQCISWYFVCDQYRNCDDGSDEDDCQPFRCPPETFQCHSDGVCLNRAKLCNGIVECADASDELDCGERRELWPNETAAAATPGPQPSNETLKTDELEAASEQQPQLSPPPPPTLVPEVISRSSCNSRAFSCKNGQCLPAYVFCNAAIDCADGSDEPEQLCNRLAVQTQAQSHSASSSSSSWSRRNPTPAPTSGRSPAVSSSPPLATKPAARRRQPSITTNKPLNSRPQQQQQTKHQPTAAGANSQQDSPLVKTDRAAIERLLAGLSLGAGGGGGGSRRKSRLFGASVSPASDANDDADECPPDTFTCGTGKCRSSAILCSGVDGCGDNSDEDQCEVCQCAPPAAG